MTVSILTACRGPGDDTEALVRALEASTLRPTELVIAWVGQPPRCVVSQHFRIVDVHVESDGDPIERLAAARNAAAAAACGGRLVFVDPGYIPSRTMVDGLVRHLIPGRVVLGELRTLPCDVPTVADESWLERSQREVDQPAAPVSGGMRQPKHLFRPEAFAISRPHFVRLGGFTAAGRFRGADEVDWSLWTAAQAPCYRRGQTLGLKTQP